MDDCDDTTLEALSSPPFVPLGREKTDSSSSVPIPTFEGLASFFETGEQINVNATSIIWNKVPGTNFIWSIFRKGKYCQSLVGVLRIEGFGNTTHGEDNNLEVIRKVLGNTDGEAQAAFPDCYRLVYTEMEHKIQLAVTHAICITPQDYFAIKKSGALSPTIEVGINTKKQSADTSYESLAYQMRFNESQCPHR